MSTALEVALSWLGTPYHHQGCIKGVGVDCAMILCTVYHEAGLIPVIDPRPYPQDWHMHRSDERYLSWVERYADPVSDPQPGDVVLYRFGRCISHGGIVIAWPTILHAYRKEGVVLADGTQGDLAGRLAVDPDKGQTGFWRIRGAG